MPKAKAALATLVLCLGSFSALYAQVRPPLDVSITSIESQNGKKRATLHVQNNSGKDVAAYQVDLVAHLADGTTELTLYLHDSGYRATKDGDGTAAHPRLLNAGESEDQVVPLTGDSVNVVASLGAVVYADRSAQGDPEKIGQITSTRKRLAKRIATEHPEHAAAAAKFAAPIDPAKIRRLP